MPKKTFGGYVAGVSRPGSYQRKVNRTTWEIIVRPTTTAIDTDSAKVVAQILRAAKLWDSRAGKWQYRVLIRCEIDRVDLERWLYGNFPEYNPSRIPVVTEFVP